MVYYRYDNDWKRITKKKRTTANYAESQFQRAVIRYLRLRNIFCFSVPNGLKLSVIQSKIAVAEGVMHGVADIIILLPQGKTVFVEMKNPNGKGVQSKHQKEFEEKVKSLGFEYYIWDSWKQVDEFVEKIKNT
jgi:hypothetical protein